MPLSSLTDEALLSNLQALHAENRRLVARIVVHLAEVETRALHLTQACSSMFDFCVRKLGMSEGAAHRRLNAARLVRRFPTVLDRIEQGEVHLSSLVLLAKHLTEANVEEIMSAVSGKSLREIEAFLARYAPRPDVAERVVELPSVGEQPPLVVDRAPSTAAGRGALTLQRIEPLSEQRYKVQITVSREVREKLERARDLMGHRNPAGDLAVIVDRALDALLVKLEKERLGKTSRPRRARKPRPGTISRAVRREVFERDGEQCTFCGEAGERCPSRTFLELDHIDPRAFGGTDDAANLRVRCRAHNRLHAEQVFGREHVARQIDFRRRKSPAIAASVTPDASYDRPAAAFEQAWRGLVSMGFAKTEARRALDDIARGSVPSDAEPPEWNAAAVLREAIAALT